MEQKQIEEGNILIAKFLDWEVGGYDCQTGDILTFYIPNNHEWFSGSVSTDDLKFERSWDLLIDCIQKIESIRNEEFGWFLVSIQSNTCSIQSKYLYLATADQDYSKEYQKRSYISDPNAVFSTKIESTWYNVVEFIKWYDNQSK